MPSFSVGVQPSQELSVGAGGPAGAGAAGAAGGGVGGSIKTKRSGFEGLEMRPLLWEAKVVGVHDVLTPINATRPAYPEEEDRDFGPWGLSFASDTWDLRRALVLDARARGGFEAAAGDRMILYVDLQTLVPLYMASYDARGTLTDLGMYVGRWSGDREGYPAWPDDPERPVRVIDPVGAAFANLAQSGSWRRESWEMVATPPPSHRVQRVISVNELTKRR